MQFEIGDSVVHPVYGVGTIKSFSKRLILGETAQEYYQVINGKSIVWVPTNDQGSTVLRKVAPKAMLDQCRSVLRHQPVPLDRDRKIREVELTNLLKGKLLPALCKTVRALRAHSREIPLGRVESDLLKKTLKELCDEWAASEGVSATIALDEIETLLHEGD